MYYSIIKQVAHCDRNDGSRQNGIVAHLHRTGGSFGRRLFSRFCNYKTYTPKEQIKIAGEFRSNGFTNLCHNTYLLFNLGAKYRQLSFSIGHVDGEEMVDIKMSIYLDGQYFNSYIIKAQEMPINISIPLQNVQQLKFSFDDGETNVEASTKIGVCDMIIK